MVGVSMGRAVKLFFAGVKVRLRVREGGPEVRSAGFGCAQLGRLPAEYLVQVAQHVFQQVRGQQPFQQPVYPAGRRGRRLPAGGTYWLRTVPVCVLFVVVSFHALVPAQALNSWSLLSGMASHRRRRNCSTSRSAWAPGAVRAKNRLRRPPLSAVAPPR